MKNADFTWGKFGFHREYADLSKVIVDLTTGKLDLTREYADWTRELK